MDDAKRAILARRARLISLALVACTPPAATPATLAVPAVDGDASAPSLGVVSAPPDAGPLAARPDRDGDGVLDADDVCPDEPGVASTNPREHGCPPKVVVRVCLSIILPPKVTFASGSAKPQDAALVDDIAQTLLHNPQIDIDVEGHSDPSEPPALAQQRADAVVRMLVARGVPAARMTATSAGATKPLAPNSTAEGRAKNRRIEILHR